MAEDKNFERSFKNNLATAWKNNTGFRIMIVIFFVVMVLAIIISRASVQKVKEENMSKLSANKYVKDVPFEEKSEVYKKALEQAEKEKEEEAINKGKSFLPYTGTFDVQEVNTSKENSETRNFLNLEDLKKLGFDKKEDPAINQIEDSYKKIKSKISGNTKNNPCNKRKPGFISADDAFNRHGINSQGYDKDGFLRDCLSESDFDENGYAADGYDKFGYNEDGYDKDGLNKFGYDRDGYNKNGYNKFGFDRFGYDKDGYDKNGYNRNGINRQGLTKDGTYRDGLTEADFGPDGYAADGYDKWGYDRDGFSKDGYDREGYDEDGYDKDGYNRNGYNRNGINRQGLNRDGKYRDGLTEADFGPDGYAADGYDKWGYDRDGYDKDGYDKWGYDRDGNKKSDVSVYASDGYDQFGYDREGYDKDGYDKNGYNRNGINRQGLTKSGTYRDGLTEADFGPDGYAADGYDKWGYDRDGYNKDGYDRNGFRRDISKMESSSKAKESEASKRIILTEQENNILNDRVSSMATQIANLVNSSGPIYNEVTITDPDIVLNDEATNRSSNFNSTKLGYSSSSDTDDNLMDIGAKAKVMIPAGTIAYAITLTESNSDVQGPVLAKILTGPLKGFKTLGSFTIADDYLVLQFNRAILGNEEYEIKAYALDPSTTLPGMATEINRHYLNRFILPVAADFIEAIGDAFGEAETTTNVSDGVVVSDTKDVSISEAFWSGASDAGETLGELIEESKYSGPTIKVHAGSEMGLLFIESIFEGDDINK